MQQQLPEGLEALECIRPEAAGLFVKIVEVTPEAAQNWLSNNHQHRSINKKRVKEYAATMNAHSWLINGKTIVFDFNGTLVGGQHRLSACVASKVTFPALVVCGVHPSVVVHEEPKAAKKAKKTSQKRELEPVYVKLYPDPNSIDEMKATIATIREAEVPCDARASS